MLNLDTIVTIDPLVQGGKPVFKGTRVTIETLFDYLETSSLDDFLNGFPSVSREQAETLIEWTKNKTNELLTHENTA
jgi:uncharacterized protein (DUF433 family)